MTSRVKQLLKERNDMGKRGSTSNAKRLQAFASGGKSGTAGWGDCDPARMQTIVVGITAMGGAVLFGLSRDMGAHSITLMLDGDKQPLWFNGDSDLNDEMDGVIATLNQMD